MSMKSTGYCCPSYLSHYRKSVSAANVDGWSGPVLYAHPPFDTAALPDENVIVQSIWHVRQDNPASPTTTDSGIRSTIDGDYVWVVAGNHMMLFQVGTGVGGHVFLEEDAFSSADWGDILSISSTGAIVQDGTLDDILEFDLTGLANHYDPPGAPTGDHATLIAAVAEIDGTSRPWSVYDYPWGAGYRYAITIDEYEESFEDPLWEATGTATIKLFLVEGYLDWSTQPMEVDEQNVIYIDSTEHTFSYSSFFGTGELTESGLLEGIRFVVTRGNHGTQWPSPFGNSNVTWETGDYYPEVANGSPAAGASYPLLFYERSGEANISALLAIYPVVDPIFGGTWQRYVFVHDDGVIHDYDSDTDLPNSREEDVAGGAIINLVAYNEGVAVARSKVSGTNRTYHIDVGGSAIWSSDVVDASATGLDVLPPIIASSPGSTIAGFLTAISDLHFFVGQFPFTGATIATVTGGNFESDDFASSTFESWLLPIDGSDAIPSIAGSPGTYSEDVTITLPPTSDVIKDSAQTGAIPAGFIPE